MKSCTNITALGYRSYLANPASPAPYVCAECGKSPERLFAYDNVPERAGRKYEYYPMTSNRQGQRLPFFCNSTCARNHAKEAKYR